MILTSTQVAEKLGVSRSVVLAMVKRGELVTTNKPKPGKKKFFPRFNSKDINEFKKGKNGDSKVEHTTTETEKPAIVGFIAEIKAMREQMNRIEDTLKKIAGWF